MRILKRIENDLVKTGMSEELPSYFMECLVYCVEDHHFGHTGPTPLTADLKAVLGYIYGSTDRNGVLRSWPDLVVV